MIDRERRLVQRTAVERAPRRHVRDIARAIDVELDPAGRERRRRLRREGQARPGELDVDIAIDGLAADDRPPRAQPARDVPPPRRATDREAAGDRALNVGAHERERQVLGVELEGEVASRARVRPAQCRAAVVARQLTDDVDALARVIGGDADVARGELRAVGERELRRLDLDADRAVLWRRHAHLEARVADRCPRALDPIEVDAHVAARAHRHLPPAIERKVNVARREAAERGVRDIRFAFEAQLGVGPRGAFDAEVGVEIAVRAGEFVGAHHRVRAADRPLVMVVRKLDIGAAVAVRVLATEHDPTAGRRDIDRRDDGVAFDLATRDAVHARGRYVARDHREPELRIFDHEHAPREPIADIHLRGRAHAALAER